MTGITDLGNLTKDQAFKAAHEAALEVAKQSSAEKRKVGCAILLETKKGWILSTGYNVLQTRKAKAGPWKTRPGEPCEDRHGETLETTDTRRVLHAEHHASLALLEVKARASAMFVFVTHQPCKGCQTELEQLKQHLGLSEYATTVVTDFMKFNQGKLRYSLLPPLAQAEHARILTKGATKYKPNNWRGCTDLDEYLDAAMRHIEKYRLGEPFDKDFKTHHLAMAAVNLNFIVELEAERLYNRDLTAAGIAAWEKDNA